jgi:hypothetical protein
VEQRYCEMATLSDYKAIIEDRPKKLDASDVDYREGEGDEICGNCIHFYRRVVDEYGVCELLRLADEESIERSYTCDFFSRNGEEFPLYPGSR